MRQIQYFIAKILGFPKDPRSDARVLNMSNEIDRRGGLKFILKVNSDGWIAECQNLDGIVTGGNELKPSILDIDKKIKDAIFSAFGIPPYLCDETIIKSPFDLETEKSTDQIDIIYRRAKLNLAL